MSSEDLTGRARIVQNVMASWLSYIVFLVAGFVLPHQIDSALGAAELGVWDFSWTFVNYLSLSAIGIGSALNRYVAKYRAEDDIPALQKAVSTVVSIQVVLALLVVLSTFIGSWYIPLHFGVESVDLASVIMWLGLALAFQFLFDTSRGVMTGVHRWDYFNALNAGCYLFAVLGMLTALYLGQGIETLAMIYACMQLMQGILRSIVARIICPEAKFVASKIDKAFAVEIAYFGIKSIVISITGLLAIQTTNILLMYKLGPIALAVFTRPIALVRHIENFLSRFTFILTPMAGSIDSLEGRQELKEFVIASAKYGMAFSLPAIVLFAVFGHLIIGLWMGASYVDEYLIAVLSLGFLLPMSQAAIVRVLIGIDEHGRAALLSLFCLLVIYPVTWWLIDPKTNVDFALLTVIPLSLVNGLVVPAYACRVLGLSVVDYFNRAFSTVLLAAVPPSVVLAFVAIYLDAGWLWSILLGGVYMSFLVTLYYFFILPVEFQLKVKSAVRHLAVSILSASGVDRFLLYLNGNRIPVLKLHGVQDFDAHGSQWQPTWERNTSGHLDVVMGELAKQFTFISLDEAVEMINGERPLRRNCMVVTFDDGYRNNIEVALPILRKYNCPLNLFVSTRFSAEREPFWIDRLDYALQNYPQETVHFHSEEMEYDFQLSPRSAFADSYKAFRKESVDAYGDDYVRESQIIRFAEDLEAQSGQSLQQVFEGDPWSETIHAEDIANLDERDCIGAHTVNHVRLPKISIEQIQYELSESKRILEQWTDKPCFHFCYPEGAYSNEHMIQVRDAGFRSASTSEIGINKVGDDVYQLKRFPFPSGTSGKDIRYHLLRNYFSRNYFGSRY